jgi:hypothetical protein
MLTEVPPLLVAVTFVTGEKFPTRTPPNATDCGDKLMVAGTTPVPVSGAVVGLGTALEATESEALSTPPAAGLNTAAMEQFAPTARVAGQLFVWEYEPVAPVIETIIPLRAKVPELV